MILTVSPGRTVPLLSRFRLEVVLFNGGATVDLSSSAGICDGALAADGKAFCDGGGESCMEIMELKSGSNVVGSD